MNGGSISSIEVIRTEVSEDRLNQIDALETAESQFIAMSKEAPYSVEADQSITAEDRSHSTAPVVTPLSVLNTKLADLAHLNPPKSSRRW